MEVVFTTRYRFPWVWLRKEIAALERKERMSSKAKNVTVRVAGLLNQVVRATRSAKSAQSIALAEIGGVAKTQVLGIESDGNPRIKLLVEFTNGTRHQVEEKFVANGNGVSKAGIARAARAVVHEIHSNSKPERKTSRKAAPALLVGGRR